MSPIANVKVSYENTRGGRSYGRVIETEVIGEGRFAEPVYTIQPDASRYPVKVLARHVQIEKEAKKAVRSIARKLGDLAEAAGDDELYGRRFDRLKPQIEELALLAIEGKHPDVGRAALLTCTRTDELLSSALVGDWTRVAQLIGDIKANTTAPLANEAKDCCQTGECESDGENQAGELTDPMTGATIRLESRNRASLLNFPCCGGLRPAHTSNCREA